VIPLVVDEVVVGVAVTPEFVRTVKPLLYREDCPSGLTTMTSQTPIAAYEGSGKVHDMWVEESTFTFVAEIFEPSDLTSLTDAPLWNPSPRRSVIETEVPA
jgi:hypothetical protein